MHAFKFFAISAVALALNAQAMAAEQTSNDSASCKQARQDLQFMQQLASSDGGTNPYLNAPLPAGCKTEQMAKGSSKKPQAGDKNYAGVAGAQRYN